MTRDTITFRGQQYQVGGDAAYYPVPLPTWFPEVLPAGWTEHPAPYGWDRDFNRVYAKHGTLRVLVSAAHYSDGKHWLHVSVSRKNRQLPTWEVMSEVKEVFIGPERTAYQVMPPRSQHVNIAEVLHLYHCLEGDVTPDFRGGGQTL